MREVRITRCQLGLFGYAPEKRVVRPAESVSESIRSAVTAKLESGRLSCADAWEIAEKLHLRKMDVSSACEKLNVRISRCQLGAF
jgi:PIN domain nuclease of toxin-antitoxin system